MPTSSRLRELLGPALRGRVPVALDDTAQAWQPIWANAMFGGRVTAAAEPARARVRVDVYWPDLVGVLVERIHADGTVYPVRGGEPATVLTAWARWDYECPLDQPVTYRITAPGRPGALATSAPVTLDSLGRDWLKHPAQPGLNRQVSVRLYADRSRQSRSAKIRPPLARYPITVHGVRQAPAGDIVLQTDGTTADMDTLQALLDDNADLLLQRPAVRGGESWWIAVDTTGAARMDPNHGELLIERVTLPYEVADRQAGDADGDVDDRYDAVTGSYPTYGHVKASRLSYLDLSMLSS